MKTIQRPRVHTLFLSTVIAFSIVLTGCATKQRDILADHEAGRGVVSMRYMVDADKAWTAATTLMSWYSAEDLQKNVESHYVTGIVGRDSQGSRTGTAAVWGPFTAFGMNSYGSYVGIWVRSTGEGQSTVDVVSRNTVVDQPQTGPKADEVHRQLAQIIAMISSGQPLPESAPQGTATK